MTASLYILPRRRERNGRHQRDASPKQIAETRAVVLAQPHRKGRTDQARISPMGRLILDGGIKPARDTTPGTLLLAAERYARLQSDIRWILDSARPHAKGGQYSRPEPTEQDRTRIQREWGDVRRALRDADRGVPFDHCDKALTAVTNAAPDFPESCFNFATVYACQIGLAALVDLWGME